MWAVDCGKYFSLAFHSFDFHQILTLAQHRDHGCRLVGSSAYLRLYETPQGITHLPSMEIMAAGSWGPHTSSRVMYAMLTGSEAPAVYKVCKGGWGLERFGRGRFSGGVAGLSELV